MFLVSWSSRCRRWGCLSMPRPRRSPRRRPACCSRRGPVRPAPLLSCRRTTQLRSRGCAPGWTASRWPSSWPRPGARLWALPSWPHGWMAIPGCCPAVRPARAGTGRWRPWCPGAMTCSARPNNGCWAACRCSGADSTLTWPNGSPAGEPLAPEAIAGLLASLAGKSLVQIQAGVTVRYSLLETVRQFAAGRLAASGEETAVHARLLGWALGVARSAEAAPPGPGRAAGPAAWRPDRPVSAPRCRGRWAAPSRRRAGNWPPGSPGGGSLPAGTAKRASS